MKEKRIIRGRLSFGSFMEIVSVIAIVTDTTHTDWDDKYSAVRDTGIARYEEDGVPKDYWDDSEAYANSVLEESARENVDTSEDWADPGSNHGL